MAHNFILGMDFFRDNCIKLAVNPMCNDTVRKIELFSALIAQEAVQICTTFVADDNYDILTDFGPSADLQVSELLKTVHETAVDMLDDEYRVKIALKDEIPFAYAPRRFAYAE